MLALVVVAGVRTLERESFRRLLRFFGWSFAAGAVVAWLILLLTGVLLARSHISSLGELMSTGYGHVLTGKIGWAVAALVATVGHVSAGRSSRPGLLRLSRGLGLLALIATLAVFYYATLLS